MPKFERPRERLIRFGPQSLNNSELLAILLRTGTKKGNVIQLATKLLSKYDLAKLSEINVSELRNFYGIGNAKACQISAAFELTKRMDAYPRKSKQKISNASEAASLLTRRLRNSNKENFYVIFLDARHNLIKFRRIFVGTLSANTIYPREIFKEAIAESAAAIILAHNHPSGDPKPSKEDIEITENLLKLGRLMGVDVLDHIIIGSCSFISLKEEALKL